MKRYPALVAAGLFAFASWCNAHGPNDPPHQLYALGDLKLDSGEVIRDFSISYVTHGALNVGKSNAIPLRRPTANYSRACSSPTSTCATW